MSPLLKALFCIRHCEHIHFVQHKLVKLSLEFVSKSENCFSVS